MSIGERIFTVRKHLEMNQTDFGRDILLSQTAVGQIENNIRTSTDRTILMICSRFNVSENWLRTGEGEMFVDNGDDFVSELAAKYQLTPFQQNLARIVYEMPVEHQEIILGYARRLLAESDTETDEERTKRIVRAARAAHDAEEADQTDKQA